MLKNMLFYSVAGSVVAIIAQAAGASLGTTLFASLAVPPLLLLAVAILRYKGLL
jgi:hypothetical protein